jgi:hypothetical protein
VAPRAEEGSAGAWHGGSEAVKAAVALLGAEGGRRSTGGPNWAELGCRAKRLFWG